MIERLTNASGDVRDLLRVPNSLDPLDLSDLEWESAVLIQRVKFEKVLLSKTSVVAQLVECEIDDSKLCKLTSHGGLIGAANTWTRCEISSCELTEMMSPQNSFRNCIFEKVDINGWILCQTLFENCRFVNCIITGMSAVNVSDPALQIAQVVKAGARAKFYRCNFQDVKFRACNFDEVSFDSCDQLRTEFDNCDLRNVICNTDWLKNISSGDPFVAFLNALVSAVKDRLGDNSICLKRLLKYQEEYLSDRTTNQDYSACLFEGDVPDDELDQLDDVFELLEDTYLGG